MTDKNDLTNFQAWLGSNNKTYKRSEIQHLINQANTENKKYFKRQEKT